MSGDVQSAELERWKKRLRLNLNIFARSHSSNNSSGGNILYKSTSFWANAFSWEATISSKYLGCTHKGTSCRKNT